MDLKVTSQNRSYAVARDKGGTTTALHAMQEVLNTQEIEALDRTKVAQKI